MEKLKQETPEGFKGKKNIYTCEKCRGHVVTVDVDDGVTPFMIGCAAASGCKGMMKSSMYRVFDQGMAASHEWYRPAVTDNLSPATVDHVLKGGLILRPAKPMGRGVAAAATVAPVHAAALNDMKEQLLIVFLRRLGRELRIPVAEIDDTGGELLAFSINDGVFHFELQRKS